MSFTPPENFPPDEFSPRPKDPRPLLNEATLTGYVLAFAAGAILALLGLTFYRYTQPAPIVIQPPPPTPTAAPTATAAPLNVYVNGAVQQPDVYTLPPGSIARDAINLAGGFTSQAVADGVNLALPLQAGMQIYVPDQDDASVPPAAVVTAPQPAGNENSASSSATGLVNLNTAGQTELEALPRIGPATAEKIIAYREENGPFAAIDDITNVSGIGPATFDGMKDLITVE